MAKQSKITVKHYLNTDLKPRLWGAYPIYVRVTFERENLRFKSVFLNNFYDSRFSFDDSKVKKRIDYETKLIHFIVNKFVNKNDVSKILPILSESILSLATSKLTTNYPFSFRFFYKKFKTELLDLICNKTEVEKKALSYVLEINDKTDSNFYKCLNTDLIANIEIKNFCEFIKTLLKFIDINYNDVTEFDKYNPEPTEVTFNFYEWKYNNGNEMFLEFIKLNKRNFDLELEILNFLIDLELKIISNN